MIVGSVCSYDSLLLMLMLMVKHIVDMGRDFCKVIEHFVGHV